MNEKHDVRTGYYLFSRYHCSVPIQKLPKIDHSRNTDTYAADLSSRIQVKRSVLHTLLSLLLLLFSHVMVYLIWIEELYDIPAPNMGVFTIQSIQNLLFLPLSFD